MSTKIQNYFNLHLFQKEQIFGCYNSTPLKMNLVLEIQKMVIQTLECTLPLDLLHFLE